MIPWLDFGLICVGATAAGFVDAVVGGGGLIATPMLFIVLPQAPIAAVLGTTKCASLFGTATAAIGYGRRMALPWRALLPGIAMASPCAFLGASLVSRTDPRVFKPAILGALVLVAVYTALRPDLGRVAAAVPSPGRQVWSGLALGALLGFYDGFLGPGTGTFLTLAFVALLGCDFLRAAGSAKLVNCASNVGALAWFAAHGLVLWEVAPAMAACNVAGALVGSRLAMAKGSAWVRRVFLVVVATLIARLAWDVLR
jgi:uncharacterized membrane protein YfcA